MTTLDKVLTFVAAALAGFVAAAHEIAGLPVWVTVLAGCLVVGFAAIGIGGSVSNRRRE